MTKDANNGANLGFENQLWRPADALGDQHSRSKDILGRTFEYFLSQFASAEGKKGGQFHTPQSVVRVLVEMFAPSNVNRIDGARLRSLLAI